MERLGEGLKKLALAGIGTAAYAVEKSADILDTLAKKGEETVEQGKVLNKELKHNVKSTIKDYKASNGKMHTVHEAEVVEAEVVEDDDIPGSATEVEDVNDHDPSLVTGRLTNNLLVHFKGTEDLIGKIVDVHLDECRGFYYMGTMISK